MLKQFVLPFPDTARRDAEAFISAPCNEQALEFVRRWPDWPATAAAIIGPPGCGKSELAHVWAARAGATVIAAPDFRGAGSAAALVIEDMDRAPADAARDHLLIEVFDDPNRPVLFTGRSNPSVWPAATGDWASRLRSLVAVAIRAPDDRFLSLLIERQFQNRQLHVPPSLVSRILTHVERTPEAVGRFVAAADGKAMSEKRPVSLRLVTEMLDMEDSPP